MSKRMEKLVQEDTFAHISWSYEDVRVLRPKWTDDQIRSWISRNERAMLDKLIELAWDVMEDLIRYDEKEKRV